MTLKNEALKIQRYKSNYTSYDIYNSNKHFEAIALFIYIHLNYASILYIRVEKTKLVHYYKTGCLLEKALHVSAFLQHGP